MYRSPLFNVTVRIKYHLKAWKSAIILALRKPNKEDYTLIKAYKLITLLNFIRKLLELIMSRKLSDLVKNYDLFPET
jgi:hypothetical protein